MRRAALQSGPLGIFGLIRLIFMSATNLHVGCCSSPTRAAAAFGAVAALAAAPLIHAAAVLATARAAVCATASNACAARSVAYFLLLYRQYNLPVSEEAGSSFGAQWGLEVYGFWSRWHCLIFIRFLACFASSPFGLLALTLLLVYFFLCVLLYRGLFMCCCVRLSISCYCIQVSVSEYGLHWNFYMTLMVVFVCKT